MNAKIRRICITSIFIAIGVVLEFFSIGVPPGNSPLVNIEFTSVPISLLGMFFGPLWGGVSGVIADNLGFLICGVSRGYTYHPGFSINAFLEGFIPGMVFWGVKKKRQVNIFIIFIVSLVFISLFFLGNISGLVVSPYVIMFLVAFIIFLVVLLFYFYKTDKIVVNAENSESSILYLILNILVLVLSLIVCVIFVYSTDTIGDFIITDSIRKLIIIISIISVSLVSCFCIYGHVYLQNNRLYSVNKLIFALMIPQLLITLVLTPTWIFQLHNVDIIAQLPFRLFAFPIEFAAIAIFTLSIYDFIIKNDLVDPNDFVDI